MPDRKVNPLILAVDTTGEWGSLALMRGGEMLEECPIHSPTGFAHVLFGSLDELLGRHGVSVNEIDCLAAASGPGSFTGVRVGLAFIKGLAEGLKKPAVAVSNLRALAAAGSGSFRAPVIDARRSQIYAAVYDAAGEMRSPEVVTDAGSWFDRLAEAAHGAEVEFVAADGEFLQSVLAGSRFAGAATRCAPRALAGIVARIALAEYTAGRGSDPAALEANYVRRSDAELFWKE